jgi:hypothetical protein
MKRVALLLTCLALTLVLSACQRLEVARPLEGQGRGELPKESLPFKDALPLEYGDLVGVTTTADHPTWAQAWFVRPDKSIVIVWVNTRTGSMLGNVVTIPRR